MRTAADEEVEVLARIWHDGWHEAHADIVPVALIPMRTLASFRPRLRDALADVRVVGPPGAPSGFCMIKVDELHQLFVSAEARGTGVAAALLADGEARLAAAGVETAWLACAIGNSRAARFYEKSGWRRAATVPYKAETAERPLWVDVWRYEKRLR